MNKNELITIVVPVYNVEKYLKKCIDSILCQTYDLLEIILVDDGSLDNSGTICDDYMNADNRVKVIHKKNGGLSDARNVGIDAANGNYITFIDSDDYINCDYINNLYEMLLLSNSEIAVCDNYYFYEEDTLINIDNKKSFKTFSKLQALQDMMYQKNISNNACGKLYKTELFSVVRYPVGRLCEDLGTTYKLFYKANNICFTSDKYYYYFQRHDSIIHKAFNLNRMDGLTFAFEEKSFISLNESSIIKSAINREFMECIYILKTIPLRKEYNLEIGKIKKIIKNNRRIVLFDKKATKKSRFLAFVSYFGVKAIKKIMILKSKI